MIFKLKGIVQYYEWGGNEFIPTLLKTKNENNQPWAEYWMGVHPKGPATLEMNGSFTELSVLLAKFPEWLGDKVEKEFGGLPFLFKILDVRKMLSIQLHPTIEQAQKGFAKEEALGIPPLAANRNYKDRNHKPEMMVALTDFWLLHGFQSEEKIRNIVQATDAWARLLPYLKEGGVKGLYQRLMSINQSEVNQLLKPLQEELRAKQSLLEKSNPDYWAWQAFQDYTRDGNYDRGIFSIYLFNLVHLKKGEAIFQDAGIPHAYLEGVNIELMANSDNVLRGGLTPKHIDVPELLDKIVTQAVVPEILQGRKTRGLIKYPVPVNDFSLNKIDLAPGASVKLLQRGPGVFLLTEGQVMVNHLNYVQGDAFFVTNDTYLEIKNKQTSENVVLFRAYVID